MKAARKREVVPADYGSDRLRHHHKLKFELVSARSGQAMRIRVLDQNEIDRLYHEGVFTQIEHSTAEKMRRDLWLIGAYGKQSSEMGGRTSSEIGAISRAAADAMARLNVMMRTLDREAGTKARRLLTSVIVDNRRVRMLDVPVIKTCLAVLLPVVESRWRPNLKRLVRRAFG